MLYCVVRLGLFCLVYLEIVCRLLGLVIIRVRICYIILILFNDDL